MSKQSLSTTQRNRSQIAEALSQVDEKLGALHSDDLPQGIAAAVLIYGFIRKGAPHIPPAGLAAQTIYENIAAYEPSFSALEGGREVLDEVLTKLTGLKLLVKRGSCYFLPLASDSTGRAEVAALKKVVCSLHQTLGASLPQTPKLAASFPARIPGLRSPLAESSVSISSRELNLQLPKEFRAAPQLARRISRFEDRVMYAELPSIESEITIERIQQAVTTALLRTGQRDHLIEALVRRVYVEAASSLLQRAIQQWPSRLLTGNPGSSVQRGMWSFQWGENESSLQAESSGGAVEIQRILLVGEGPHSQALVFSHCTDVKADTLRPQKYAAKLRAVRAYLGNQVAQVDHVGVVPFDVHDYLARERTETAGLGRTISKVLENNSNYYLVTDTSRNDLKKLELKLCTEHGEAIAAICRRQQALGYNEQEINSALAFLDERKGVVICREMSERLALCFKGLLAHGGEAEAFIGEQIDDMAASATAGAVGAIKKDEQAYRRDCFAQLRSISRALKPLGPDGQARVVQAIIKHIPILDDSARRNEYILSYRGIVAPRLFLKRVSESLASLSLQNEVATVAHIHEVIFGDSAR